MICARRADEEKTIHIERIPRSTALQTKQSYVYVYMYMYAMSFAANICDFLHEACMRTHAAIVQWEAYTYHCVSC